MTVLGIKAHLKAPTAVAPRHCELLPGWAGAGQTSGAARSPLPCVGAGSGGSCWVWPPHVYVQHWEETFISAAPPEKTWGQIHSWYMILKGSSPCLCCRTRIDALRCSDEAVCFPVLTKEIVDEQGHWHEKA